MDLINNKSVATELEAWVGILYSCMSVDMQITKNEITVLSRILVTKQKFAEIDVESLCKKAAEAKGDIGELNYIRECSKLIAEDDKNMIFALALEILLADGILEQKEKDFIEIVSNSLEIAPKMSSKIIEVIFLKNKGNVKGI